VVTVSGTSAGGDQFAATIARADRRELDGLAENGGRAWEASVLVERVLESRESDGFGWRRRDGLKWLRLALVVVLG
jgi:hypothetical protein